jgi:DNA-directed RNA polymerase
VERERIRDAAAGLKIAQVLEGYIRRKVIKQTVMTTVYGVTRFGARLQIARQLKGISRFVSIYWELINLLTASNLLFWVTTAILDSLLALLAVNILH